MKLTMLGTGHAGVTKCYNTCFILEDAGKYFLVDTGGGNTLLKQLGSVGISLDNIHDIFITHRHLDHLTGALWILRRLFSQIKSGRPQEEYRFYAHDEVIRLLLKFSEGLFPESASACIGKGIDFIEVRDQETRKIIGHDVTFFDIHSTKARQFGFKMDLDKEAVRRRLLVCFGDEPCTEETMHNAESCTWMLHEAFCLYEERERYKPYEKHHSTVKEACQTAEKLGIRNLVLYHTEDDELPSRKKRYTKEGKQYFGGNLYV
ncbi:MAG: MBL fold metallo-hydrolase, partial [Firmicutes bacterium]|nr:MBL fold metallo-hydrolase [Bacillota bacterium]